MNNLVLSLRGQIFLKNRLELFLVNGASPIYAEVAFIIFNRYYSLKQCISLALTKAEIGNNLRRPDDSGQSKKSPRLWSVCN